MRRGFRAIVGESFAEIFFGNCVALGLPCVTLAPADLAKLFDSVELDPAQEVTVDLEALTVTCRAGRFAAAMPDGARSQLLGRQLGRDRGAPRGRRRHRAHRRRPALLRFAGRL